ncbi:TPA: hypothetical protein RMT52_005054 [Escherichia coli]|nr:hypothetical protein [Escherichia coli]
MAVYIYFYQIPAIPLLNIGFGFITGHYFRTNVTQPTRALRHIISALRNFLINNLGEVA